MNNQTPIFSALCQYRNDTKLRLHMPGHVGGRGVNEVLQAIAAIDVTEVADLDDLHLPQGIIADSQRCLAQAVGADKSYYLVNGASSGIQALLMSLTANREPVLLPRSCHRSFFAGMVLSGAMPVYIPSLIDDELGLELAIRTGEVEKSLQQNPAAKVLFVTSPSYFGTCSDVKTMVTLAEQYNKPVLVDEAHGGHFPFHEDYPPSALSQGAAAAVNGLHKTWPVLNQGACLHLNPAFPEGERLRQAISLLTTTSPSYPLLASLELARCYLQQEGAQRLELAQQWSGEYKNKINQIKGLHCYGEEFSNNKDIVACDPLKIVVSMPGLRLNGYQLSQILRDKYHIQTEMANENIILAMFSLLHEKADWEQFYLALQEIAEVYGSTFKSPLHIEAPPSAKVVLSPREAFYANKKTVKLADSVNQIAGEIVAVYPPGIPCLLPGERITAETLDYLAYVKASGARIQGPMAADLCSLQIID